MAVSVVSFSFSMAAQPEPWSLLGAGFPYNISSISISNPTRLTPGSSNSTVLNSSALYYLQTSTQWYGHASTLPQLLPISSDRDVSLPLPLEWPVWSSSSRNNCHAVQRSLPCGASVYESIMGFFFYLVPFHQPISARAISSHNCH